MKNESEKLAETKALNIADVRRCICLIDGLHMDERLFNRLADDFAEHLFNAYGADMLKNIALISHVPQFWQLKYCA